MSELDPALIITELFAACALIANIAAYSQQGMNTYRIYSGVAMLLLAIHFFRLDAYAASVGCSLAFIRNIVALKYNDWITTGIFVGLSLLGLVVEWLYLQHGPEIFIAYTTSIIFTIGTLRLQSVIHMRRWFTLAEALNLLYAIVVGSLFGSVYCIFNLVVLLVLLYKTYHGKKEPDHISS